jgi:hypothetical protein
MSDTAAAPTPGAASALLSPPASGAPATTTTPAPAATSAPTGAIRFMSDAFHKDGAFNEGWSENFGKAGLGRL